MQRERRRRRRLSGERCLGVGEEWDADYTDWRGLFNEEARMLGRAGERKTWANLREILSQPTCKFDARPGT
jgi:hypothetical protein